MQEMKEDTFSGNKNEDAHDHVDRVLNIGPIPGMTPTQALMAIQTIANHSQKWHDGTSSRNVRTTVILMDLLQLRPAPFNESNGAKFRVGPPGYYTRTDNRPPYGEKRPSLEELMNKHQEESAQRSAKMEEWIKKL
uniref:Phospholipase D n=1 Tax=Tanacetum cinerariifolium TaxID=118510 RepID=A0A699HC25_TANCI|nr:phospholipase D [Tanacetum cinerariifolium]